MEKEKAKAVSPWKNSKAKQLLFDDNVEGMVTDMMPYSEVYQMRPEFQKYEKTKFRTNFFNLLTSIRKNQDAAVRDNEALLHDVQVLKDRPRGITWNGSDAQEMLIKDVDNGIHVSLAPQELWNSREEYKMFPLKCFCDHIYQEICRRKVTNYWLERSKKKKKKK
jgi:hypothetical protein